MIDWSDPAEYGAWMDHMEREQERREAMLGLDDEDDEETE